MLQFVRKWVTVPTARSPRRCIGKLSSRAPLSFNIVMLSFSKLLKFGLTYSFIREYISWTVFLNAFAVWSNSSILFLVTCYTSYPLIALLAFLDSSFFSLFFSCICQSNSLHQKPNTSCLAWNNRYGNKEAIYCMAWESFWSHTNWAAWQTTPAWNACNTWAKCHLQAYPCP